VFFGFDGVRVAIGLVRTGLVLASAQPLGAISTGDAINTGQATVSSPKANAVATARRLASQCRHDGEVIGLPTAGLEAVQNRQPSAKTGEKPR